MISAYPNHRETRIEFNLRCAKCGYNLRMQALDGRCPECGTEVAETLRAGNLAYSDPRWLRNISIGCILLVLAPAASIFVLMCPRLPINSPTELLAVVGSGLVPLAVGLHLLTRPEPPPRIGTRRANRIRLALLLGGWLWFILMGLHLMLLNIDSEFLKLNYLVMCGLGVIVLSILPCHLFHLVTRGVSPGLRSLFLIASTVVIAAMILSLPSVVSDFFSFLSRDIYLNIAEILIVGGIIGDALLLVLTVLVFAAARRKTRLPNASAS